MKSTLVEALWYTTYSDFFREVSSAKMSLGERKNSHDKICEEKVESVLTPKRKSNRVDSKPLVQKNEKTSG